MVGPGRMWMGLMGAFFLAWGGWELAEMLGWVPEARFPWPLFIVLLGAAFVFGAVTRGSHVGWGCWDEGERRGDDPRQP